MEMLPAPASSWLTNRGDSAARSANSLTVRPASNRSARVRAPTAASSKALAGSSFMLARIIMRLFLMSTGSILRCIS